MHLITQAVRRTAVGNAYRLPIARSRVYSASRYASTLRSKAPRASYSSIHAALATLAALVALPLLSEAVRSRKGSHENTKVPETGVNNTPGNMISYDEVKKHNTRESCWIVVHGEVYDITSFIPSHPGGIKPIIKNAGKDVTALFDSVHPKGVLNTMLSPEQRLGPIDPATLPKGLTTGPSEDEIRVKKERAKTPPLASMLNLYDIEAVARKVLSKQAWSYYRSDAEDGYSYQNNLHSFKHYFFRPRILRNVETVQMTTTILGIPSSLPIFVSPAAMAGLGDPLGEVNITRGAGKMGIIQGISSNSSCSMEEIAAARVQESQPLIFQLYLRRDPEASEAIMRRVEELGFRAVMLTVDAPILGKRELDMRTKELFDDEGEFPDMDLGDRKPGIAAGMNGAAKVNIGWEDVEWLTRTTKLPIIIKGIQTVEDCLLATEYPGVKGVFLSNHGGRQSDYAPAAIDVLYELRQKHPEVFDKVEVYVDGGFRRGTDVLKAICLGAKACGLGRPFLYANGAYGERGVVKTVRILAEELKNAMQQIGLRDLSEAKPEYVQYMERHVPPAKPTDFEQ